jgi:hypothetical protein
VVDRAAIIEVEAKATGEGLPEDYRVARELALVGSHGQAKRIYLRLLAETASHSLEALIYNDLAALAVTAGDTRAARDLLKKALEIDAECDAALENLSALGFDHPPIPTTNGTAEPRTCDSAKLPIYGFMHVGLMNHWHDIVEEQFLKLHASGLWDRTERIFVGVVGPRHEEFDFEDEKLEVVYRSADFQEAEFPTLSALQRVCSDHECLVYYIHTKGNFHVSDATCDWRHLMEYFVIG